MKNPDLIIIGAGAAGLLASIRAAMYGQKVLVLEKMQSAGKKILITGKGRCNITNSDTIKDFITQVFPDGRFLYPAFKEFFNEDILALLEDCGVETILERGGRYFPKSEKAADVVDALYKKAIDLGVEFIFNAKVLSVEQKDGKINSVTYLIDLEEVKIQVKNVIICTGGKSYPGTGSTGDGYIFAKKLGHKIEKLLPALVPVETFDENANMMQGLSLKNINASLIVDGSEKDSEFGELLFTHYGLSGPVILTLSRKIVLALEEKRKVKILIDFKPALSFEKLDLRILRDLDENGKMKLANLFKFWLPQKAIPVFYKLLNIDLEKKASQVSAEERKKIVFLLKNMEFSVKTHRGYKEAVVTAGGVCLNEINPKTMASKLVKGLYFAGEVLDLDANTGGYNLQIAFSTGWLAGGLY
ncbi:MAG: NAD(P)/FAD-dependent oxidoreductase [Bacteroidales bacterium]|nr:NAD(P)/FAD-dependent oxidoreductase [Bacteroidales bacterium]MCK9499126.1 NAD(P)/FAD-dependent oxidoreductase [Bacteroidales bacterium]MDY0315609.1 NAD(P)/FAD-dependent oxidoreductase [Bacteroidales bacterium]NLB85822.1 NAD(P)/FAD-dependent oxidoreductase [Bacteroidales bacterium]